MLPSAMEPYLRFLYIHVRGHSVTQAFKSVNFGQKTVNFNDHYWLFLRNNVFNQETSNLHYHANLFIHRAEMFFFNFFFYSCILVLEDNISVF